MFHFQPLAIFLVVLILSSNFFAVYFSWRFGFYNPKTESVRMAIDFFKNKLPEERLTIRQNRIVCLLNWIVPGGILFFLFSLFVPGFVAHQENLRIDQTANIAESIRISLKEYADNNPNHRYPEDISDYAALRTIVNKHGGSLPEKQSDVAIKQIHYLLDYDNDYNLTIVVDVPDEKYKEKFILVTSDGITRHSKRIVNSTGYKAKEIARDNRFIIDKGDTVVDTRTGLMWAHKDNGKDINWHDAKKFCTSYQGGGHTDWRMPTINELSTIYDEKKENRYGYHVSPLINISACCLWTSKLRDSDATRLDFDRGNQHWAKQSVLGFGRALPVRGGK